MSEPTLRVTTMSGAVYEFSDGMTQVRRLGIEGHPMRKDGVWVACHSAEGIGIGQNMVLWLSDVSDEGPTRRITTPVVDIEGVSEVEITKYGDSARVYLDPLTGETHIEDWDPGWQV